ncbi:hypothetical protein MRB53_038615 [Persea americana]|nr:hypothetical protein MRB53_038615 [Persea americana]
MLDMVFNHMRMQPQLRQIAVEKRDIIWTTSCHNHGAQLALLNVKTPPVVIDQSPHATRHERRTIARDTEQVFPRTSEMREDNCASRIQVLRARSSSPSARRSIAKASICSCHRGQEDIAMLWSHGHATTTRENDDAANFFRKVVRAFEFRGGARPSSLTSWTCRNCQRLQSKSSLDRRRHASTTAKSAKKPKRRRGLIAAAAMFGTGVVFVETTDTGNYYLGAAQRRGGCFRLCTFASTTTGRTLNKKDALSPEDASAMLKACHKRCAERTLVAMEKNGSVFIKLGQHLSSLTYLLPSEWCDTLHTSARQMPRLLIESIKAMVEQDTGVPFSSLFTDFDPIPLGAASLAQVHKAIDRASGQTVAVKCQHPVLDHWAPLDLALTRMTFQALKSFFPDYDLTWLSSEMEVSLPQELDFAQEGQNAIRAREYFSHLPSIPLVIPKVVWAKRRVLVMEYITGARPDDLAYLDAHGISRDEVAATLATSSTP